MYAFIHGAGCTRSVWLAQHAAFHGSRLLALPGREGVPNATTFSGYQEAVLAQLAEPAILVGSSLGAEIALAAALAAPERVRAVVAVGGGARMRVGNGLLETIATRFADAVDELAQSFFADPVPSLREAAVHMVRHVGAELTLTDFRVCDGIDLRVALPDLAVPVAALCGSDDAMMPPRFSEELASLTNGTMRTIPDAGHLAMCERPDAFNAALRDVTARFP